MELTMNRGDLVAIIKKQDPMGNTDRWFVHNGGNVDFLFLLFTSPTLLHQIMVLRASIIVSIILYYICTQKFNILNLIIKSKTFSLNYQI